MGREIKFRAKVLNSNNWIYRQPFHIRGTWYMYNSLWDMVPIEHKTIGQYTGLKDKNGTEIYEGDIIRYVDSADRVNTLVVKWNIIDASFDFGWVRTRYASTDGEVIGNIYENPELLESN